MLYVDLYTTKDHMNIRNCPDTESSEQRTEVIK